MTTVPKLPEYTVGYARSRFTHNAVRGIISGDEMTLRIDVFDDLENWVALDEDGNPCDRPLTYT